MYMFLIAIFLTSLVVATIDLELLKPEEIALLQFDSRPLKNYWLTAATWNNYYCLTHGHVFLYYSTMYKCSHMKETLAAPWCKVKAMLQASHEFPKVKLFIYMDSDAVINKAFFNISVNHLLGVMQRELNWDVVSKPLVFNQDGPCWWCDLVKRVGYSVCLNAGTVMWYRHKKSLKILSEWWDASMDPYEGNPIKRRFRLKWPWEQDRQMAVYNRTPDDILIASQPGQAYMTKRPRTGSILRLPRKLSWENIDKSPPRQEESADWEGIVRRRSEDWCLSHIPYSNCFIAHYCEGEWSKRRMMKEYAVRPELLRAAMNKRKSDGGRLGFKINLLLKEGSGSG